MERILITGASRGIGRAMAVRLAAPGRELILHGRDATALAETAGLVAGRDAGSRVVTGDLARTDDVEALAAAVSGALDVLVNNAGEAVVKPIEAVALEEWQRSLAAGVTAPFLLIQRLLAQMPGGASIVNILSIAARRGFSGWSAYCASKFALEGLSQCVREEARDRGVRVINVYPAATDTALWKAVSGRWPRERMIAPEEVAEAVAYALARPHGTVVDTIEIGQITGAI